MKFLIIGIVATTIVNHQNQLRYAIGVKVKNEVHVTLVPLKNQGPEMA